MTPPNYHTMIAAPHSMSDCTASASQAEESFQSDQPILPTAQPSSHSNDTPSDPSSHSSAPSISSAPTTPTSSPRPPPLKTWSLAILIFYTVSGGPFGIEPAIRSAGNFYSILGFLLLPLVWSVPEALVAAELGSSFRHASGGVAWVEEAYGESLGFLCGFLSWVSGATDNAIYPVLFLEYVGSVLGYVKTSTTTTTTTTTTTSITTAFGSDDEAGYASVNADNFGGEQDYFLTGWQRFSFVSIITIALALLNYRGLDIVGHTSLVVCIISMSPFILMAIMGASQVVPSRWLETPDNNHAATNNNNDYGRNNDSGGTDSDLMQEMMFDDDFFTAPGPLPPITLGGILWRPFLNTLFWNLNSFDSAASFAPECTNHKTVYPNGIFLGLFLTIICYIIPLLIATGATDNQQSDWQDGHLGAVAVQIGGSWLGAWTVFASGISNLSQFLAEMSSDAFLLMGMAEQGYLPEILATRSKYGTPTYGIFVGVVVIISFGWADFGVLIELLNANYAISLLLEYGAFVWLRLYRKEMERPYRIPIPDWAAVLFVIPPVFGILLIFLISSWFVYMFVIGAVVLGLIVLKHRKKSSRWGSVRENISRSDLGVSIDDDLPHHPLIDGYNYDDDDHDIIGENGHSLDESYDRLMYSSRSKKLEIS